MFKSQDPRKKDRESHWTMENVEPGTGFNAWKAGDVIGVLCHWCYRSVPCRDLMTDGALECPHHATSPNLHWVGYVPIYTEENRPMVVIVRAANQESVGRIPVHAPVYVARAKKKGAGVSVRPKPWAKNWQPPRGFTGPADIRRWLLKLWKDDDLAQWVLSHPVSDSPVSSSTGVASHQEGEATHNAPVVRSVDESDPDVRRLRALMEQSPRVASSDDNPVSLAEALPSLNGRHREPGRNGSHRKGEG